MRLTTKVAGLCVAVLAQAALARAPAPELPHPDEIPIAILVDLSSGQVLHQRNADRRFMPASITKVMTTFLAFELIDQGKLKPDQRFRFSPAAYSIWGNNGSTMFLAANDELAASDLLLGVTTVSGNDAAVALAEGAVGSLPAWTSLMNVKAAELGMTQSHFGTPNGLPDEGRTFVTARDLAKLGSALVRRHPELYARYYGHRRLTYRGITQPNHDPFTGQVRGGDGIKTGFTNEAGYGFLGSAKRGNRRLVLVVAGAERGRIRDNAARAYLEWGFQMFDTRPLFAAGVEVGKARVQGGASRRVPLMAKDYIGAAMPQGQQRQLTLTVHYDGPLRAPISKGQQVAELEIAVEGMEPSRVPLYAGADVPVAGTFARLVNGVLGWFG